MMKVELTCKFYKPLPDVVKVVEISIKDYGELITIPHKMQKVMACQLAKVDVNDIKLIVIKKLINI